MKPSAMSVHMETSLIINIEGLNHRLTLEKARDLHEKLGQFISANAQSKETQKIKACVVEHFGLNAGTFSGRCRRETYAWPRMIAMFLSWEMRVSRITLTELGREFGRNHTTVMYNIRRIKELIEMYPEKRKDVEAIRAKLNGHVARKEQDKP